MRLYVCPGIFLLLALTGCALPVVQRVGEFSSKAAPTIVDERGVYELVEATHARRLRIERIANYETTSMLAPVPETRFGGEADIRARVQVLDLLQAYIDGLADVSGNGARDKVDKASRSAAIQIGTSIKNDLPALTRSSTSPVTDTEVSAAGRAIDGLGTLLLERRRSRELPAILEQGDGPVSTLCELLRKDLGDPQTSGLRHMLRTDFEAIETAEDAAIRDHPKAYSYPERREAIEALFAEQEKQAAADAALAKADAALLELERTHAELARTARQTHAPGFRALLAQLVAEGRRLSELEGSASR